MRNRLIAVFVSFLGAYLLLHAAPSGRQAPPSEAGAATPRWSDGRVNLGAPPGTKGLWEGSGRLVINPNSYDANRGVQSAPVHIDDVPLQPWARALIEYRHINSLKDEPYTRCKPSPGPRFFGTAYGIRDSGSPGFCNAFTFL